MPRVLIVDDERSTAWLMERYLSEAGFETVSTPDAAEAASLLRDRPDNFDLLVTDVLMPEFTGYDLAKLARQNSPEYPVLFVSAFSFDPLTPARANSAFVPKPFNKETLVGAVYALLGLRPATLASAARA